MKTTMTKVALVVLCAISTAPASFAKSTEATTSHESVSVFESAVYGDLFGTAEMRSVFSDKAMVNQWINVEMALAKSQSKVGIIPLSAYQSIKAAGEKVTIDYATLKKGTNKVGRGIKPLLKQLKKAGDKNVSGYLHFGSTTQDIMDTATALQVKNGSELIRVEMVELANQIAVLADQHKNTVMIARSNGQDAVPTTFGLHLTTYLMELVRNIDRLDEASSRLTAQIGSTVGTLAPYGDKGLALQKVFADELGLAAPIAPWNPSRDVFAEMVQTLAMVDATLGRVAVDINNLGRTQINEVKEGESGASSTMPQKRNPRASEFMGGFNRMGKMYNAASLDIMSHTDTRQGSPWILEWSIIPESFMVTSASLERAQRMFAKLLVNEQQMLDNFASASFYSMSEALMNKLTEKVGRSDAYSIVKKAIKAAKPEDTLSDVANNSVEINKHLTSEEIKAVLKPENYLGSSAKIVERSVEFVQNNYKR
ncbi:3-carboxy-cis,cis-muconate cycloisomerase [Vibrio sp. MACH09]|uniref:class-II fumarase/aspartase family protein n=1 Tax=Vibrio sp. MACH09 TaxID=3025122 RepID=UPI00279449A6|nr:adenylosuccinate lyase family protein [Vibrio sp. MACH09]GLO63539.1 3-carboxy-cis,cis-muconate cycloisomerase [Vibrio sp. MACH09]